MKFSKKILSVMCAAILFVMLLTGGAMMAAANGAVSDIAFGKINERDSSHVEGGLSFGMYGSNAMEVVPENSKDTHAERYAFFMPANPNDTNQFVVQKALVTPVDLTAIDADMNNVNLTFWLFVSDVSALPAAGFDSTLELGGGSICDDNNEMSTALLTDSVRAALVNGWNRFSLPVGKLATSGTVNEASIKFMRMYITSFDETKTGVDTGFRMGLTDVRFVKAVTAQDETVKIIETEALGLDVASMKVIHASDKVSDLSETSASVMDATFSPSAETASSTSVLLPVGYGNIQTTLDSAVDASAFGIKAAGSVWFYINDVNYINDATDAAIRIGESDAKCAAFPIKQYVGKLKSGWNHIVFYLNQNGVDLANIKFFRIYIDKFGGIPGLQFGFNNATVVKSNNLYDMAVLGYEDVSTVDGEAKEFGRITQRTAEYVREGKMFGLYGSADREIAPKNSTEKFSELYAFQISDTTPSQLDVHKVLNNPIDLTTISSEKSKIGLSFWLYISNPAAVTASGDSRIIVSNYGGTGEYDIDFAAAVKDSLVSGWNRIIVNLGAMRKPAIDTVNLKTIDSVRMFLPAFDGALTKDSITGFRMGLNDVRFIYTEQTEAIKVSEIEKRQVFKAESQVICDTSTFDGLDGGSIGVVSSENVPQGSIADLQKSIILNVGYGGFSKNMSPAIDMSGVTFSKPKMAYSFWFYVNDTRKIKNNDVLAEITSGGNCDIEEVQVNLRDYADRMVNGWNHVVLNLGLYDANPVIKVDGIDYVRMAVVGFVPGLQIGFHDLRVCEANTMEQVAIVSTQRDPALSLTDVLETGDSATDWTNVTVQNEQAVGAGNSLLVNADASSAKKTVSFNMSTYDESKTVVNFWMYTSNPSDLTAASFKMGSASDKLYSASLPVSQMKSGWTQFEIKLSELATGEIDKSAINFIQLDVTRTTSKVAFDLIEVLENGKAAAGVTILQKVVIYPPAEPNPDNKVSIGSTGSSNGFGTHAIGVYTNKGPDDSDAIFGSSIHNIGIDYKFRSVDITETVNPNNAVLTFWLYINDTSRLTAEGAVDLCSTRNLDDGNKYSWHFGSRLVGTGEGQLQAGKWNKLAFAIGGNSPVGTVDLTNLQYFRVFNIGENNRPYDDGTFEMKMMIADIKIAEADVSSLSAGKVIEQRDFTYSEPTKDDVKMPTDLENGFGGDYLPQDPHGNKVVNNEASFKNPSNIGDVLLSVIPAIVLLLAGGAAVALTVKKRKKG